MMKMAGIVGLAAALTVLVGPGALAASNPDPKVEVVKVEEKAIVDEAISPQTYIADAQQKGTKISSKEQASILASSCRRWGTGVSAKNGFGQLIISYRLDIDYCYNGTNITARNGYYREVKADWGWTFEGHESGSSGGVGNPSWKPWTKGEFCYLRYGGCVRQKFATVWLRVYGNGSRGFGSDLA
ncbi:hypothetical protein [Nonomuraea basaltis]|uniref:hypothetical protein n=1 Tax=Nonomuraea basaltis TaxID=2495887 RepID=UPI00110C6500|nr:hypothetical protein [Nonomuraea basaltis]TMR99596.1 hypothetical protein EJK15_07215 [Nonomuraea basaltis]